MTAGPAAGAALEQAVATLQRGVSRLAQAMYETETAPEFALTREPGRLRGRSAAVASEASERIAGLWERYPLLKEAVERAEASLAQGDMGAAGQVVGRKGVRLPDGSTVSPQDLLTALERDLERARQAAAELARAWRDVVPRLDQAAVELAAATQRAADLGIPDEPDVTRARAMIAELAARAASDPLAVDPDAAETAVEQARARIDTLLGQRHSLPQDLAAARALLETLTRTIGEGREALEATRSRIADAKGLEEPLDDDVVEGRPHGLRAWLARLEADAARGSWVAAATGLTGWRTVATDAERRARQVLAANRAPLQRRNDLRGLLDAYRAKSGAAGRAEDRGLTSRYRAARDALYTAPCDLRAAEALVAAYVRAVNDQAPEGR